MNECDSFSFESCLRPKKCSSLLDNQYSIGFLILYVFYPSKSRCVLAPYDYQPLKFPRLMSAIGAWPGGMYI